MIGNVDIRQLASRFILQDKNGYALSMALEVLLNRMTEAMRQGLGILLHVDVMPAWRLDEMAWEWNVTWYDYNADIETKRRTIAGMNDVFKTAGTPSAVRAVIEQYFGDGEVQEWPEYDANPYHFRVTTANPRATNESARQLAVIVEMVKNARSVYDGAMVERVTTLNLAMGQRAFLGRVFEFTESR